MDSPARRRRSVSARLTPVPWPEAARALVGVAGLALLVIAAVKFTQTTGDGGTIALVIVGAILLICPFVLDRVQRVSVSTTQVDLWLTTQVTDRGAPETAAILHWCCARPRLPDRRNSTPGRCAGCSPTAPWSCAFWSSG